MKKIILKITCIIFLLLGFAYILNGSMIVNAACESGHTLIMHEQVPSTCTTHGHWAYYECTVCGKFFEDSEGTKEIEDLPVWKSVVARLPLLPHDLFRHDGEAAHCDVDGYVDYYECSVCHGLFDKDGYHIHDFDVWKINSGKIAAPGHNIVKQEATATCTMEGIKQYYKCSDCGACYEDSLGITPIADFDSWKNGDGKQEKLPHTFAIISAVNPSEASCGHQEYYQCVKCLQCFSDAQANNQILDLNAWLSEGGEGYIKPLAKANNKWLLILVVIVCIPVIIFIRWFKRRY